MAGKEEFRVLLFRSTGWGARLIQWQTRSPYSHAAIGRGSQLVESIQGVGVRQRRWSAAENVDAFAVPDLTDAQWHRAWEFSQLHLGEDYDWRGVLRFVSRIEHSSKRPLWFCSELVFAALAHAGLPVLARTKASHVSPAMLALSPLLIRA